MSRPEYTNLFTISTNDKSKDIALNFYNDWYDQLDLIGKKESPERNTEQVASVVMSYYNAKMLSEVLATVIAERDISNNS